MFKIWSERGIPAELRSTMEGFAVEIGPAAATPDDPFVALPGAHAIIAGGGRFTGEVMDRAPKLLIIARLGAGYETVDIPAATQRRIAVTNAPDAPTTSTAEHALALILAMSKKLKNCEHRIKTQKIRDFYRDHNALELSGSRLGLIGLGRIGKRVGKLCQALGMKVAAYDPYVTAEQASELDVELRPTIKELLADADVVSIHAPLTPESRHTINAETLGYFKRGAILVNAARGGLVDETALPAALDSGRLGAAGLDVTDPEPPAADHPLLDYDNVMITPHVGSGSVAGKLRIATHALERAVCALRGERPENLLNPDVWPEVEARIMKHIR